jgi:hypothetical protein
MRERVSTALLAVASLLLLGLALELAARVWLPVPHHHASQALVFDPEFGYTGEPGAELSGFDAQGPFTVRFDAQGLRRREHESAAAAPGARRIALLGDSFVVALGVRDDDTIAGQLEQRLAEHGQPARVHDLAVLDYGTAQQLLWLRERTNGLTFDTLVLALYSGNDFANNTLALAGRTGVSPGDVLRPYWLPRDDGGFDATFGHPLRARLRGVSRAFVWLEHRVLSFAVRRELDWLLPWPARESMSERLRAGLGPREELEIHREPAPGSPWADAWATTERLLLALRDEARARHTRFVVLVIPPVPQVQDEALNVALDLEARAETGKPLDQLLDWNLPERRLAPFFAAEGIESVFLLDAFRAAAARGPALYISDGHFAAAGHALAARVLAEALASPTPVYAGPPSSAGPTPLLPSPAEAPSLLDFRSAPFEPYLERGGWLTHRISGSAAGWLPASRARLVLPVRRGDLVVRLRVPESATLPIAARLRQGPHEARAELALPGEFELRLPAPFAQDEARWTQVALAFQVSATVGRRPAELYVESVGFDARP